MIRWRLSLAYPVLALISFAALAVALPLYLISVNSLKQSIDAMELNKAMQTHYIAEAAIKNEVDKLAILSKTLEKHRGLTDALKDFNKSGDPEALKKKIDPVVAELDVGFVKLVNPDEKIIYQWNTSISSELNIWGVAEALQGQEMISTSRHAEGFALRAIAPVQDQNDEIMGAIIIGFIINEAFADRISSLANTDILIGSLQGVIAASHSINNNIKHDCRKDPSIHTIMLDSIKDDKTSHKELCQHNEIFYFRRLLIVDEMFSLMVEIDTSQAQKHFTITKHKIAATAGTVFVIAWLLGIMLTKAMIKPLQELRDQSCQTVKHITGKTVDVHSGNELDALVGAFKLMQESLAGYISDLRKAENELREHRNHLEELVVDRTENLKKTNEQLRTEINDRKHAEQELTNSNKKLNNSTLQLQEFVYVASHDMREPLRKILAFTQMLTTSLSGRLNEDEQENFNFVLEGADKMQKMVESLLAYSKLIAPETKNKEVDLNTTIAELKNAKLRSEFKKTDGRLLIPESLPAVKGNAAQIQQLFQNLISNALKYRKKGIAPQITIRAHHQDDGMVRIEVQDNGTGIKLEYHHRIFEMFRRVRHDDKNSGIGAGLAICKRIVEQHNGEIGVDSTEDQGATFWFTLPALESRQKKNTEPALSSKE